MTAQGINTHGYQQAVNKTQTWIKTGEVKVLWGLLVFPTGRIHEQVDYLPQCKFCGQEYLTPIHGHHNVKGWK